MSCFTSLNALAREPTSLAMRFSSSSKTSHRRLVKMSGRMKSLYFGASFAPRMEHAASQIQDSSDLSTSFMISNALYKTRFRFAAEEYPFPHGKAPRLPREGGQNVECSMMNGEFLWGTGRDERDWRERQDGWSCLSGWSDRKFIQMNQTDQTDQRDRTAGGRLPYAARGPAFFSPPLMALARSVELAPRSKRELTKRSIDTDGSPASIFATRD